jgi:hypothetical protein
MGEPGRDLCARSGVSWVDLSGNARIVSPGLLIHVEGRPNRFRPRGRPWSAFAAKSSRVARLLLRDPAKPRTQREIARETGLGESFVSKIVRRLEEDALLSRDAGTRAVRPRAPDLLLEAWAEEYRFSRHEIIRAHVYARSGDDLARQLSAALARGSLEHAATGLAAAWLLAPFAAFRLASFYVAREPDRKTLENMGFRETSSGANVWLVVPDDEGVFQGGSSRSGIPCVHPVQAVLDLRYHPERAAEAAAEVERSHLEWKEKR